MQWAAFLCGLSVRPCTSTWTKPTATVGAEMRFRISHAREEVSPRRWNSPEAMIFIILNALRFASGNPHQLKLASQARIDRSTFSGSSLFGMGSNDLSLEA